MIPALALLALGLANDAAGAADRREALLDDAALLLAGDAPPSGDAGLREAAMELAGAAGVLSDNEAAYWPGGGDWAEQLATLRCRLRELWGCPTLELVARVVPAHATCAAAWDAAHERARQCRQAAGLQEWRFRAWDREADRCERLAELWRHLTAAADQSKTPYERRTAAREAVRAVGWCDFLAGSFPPP